MDDARHAEQGETEIQRASYIERSIRGTHRTFGGHPHATWCNPYQYASLGRSHGVVPWCSSAEGYIVCLTVA